LLSAGPSADAGLELKTPRVTRVQARAKVRSSWLPAGRRTGPRRTGMEPCVTGKPGVDERPGRSGEVVSIGELSGGKRGGRGTRREVRGADRRDSEELDGGLPPLRDGRRGTTGTVEALEPVPQGDYN
jgi:hypothetical protein